MGRAPSDLVELTSLHVTARGVEAIDLMVPQSYINQLMGGVSDQPLQQGLIGADTWTTGATPPCNTSDLWIADNGWAHYGCINYDGVPSTGTCEDLATMFRYVAGGVRHYWGNSVYHYRPGNWNGCFLSSVDCSTGVLGNYTANSCGGVKDPNGSSSCWYDGGGTGQINTPSANSVYAGTCPG